MERGGSGWGRGATTAAFLNRATAGRTLSAIVLLHFEVTFLTASATRCDVVGGLLRAATEVVVVTRLVNAGTAAVDTGPENVSLRFQCVSTFGRTSFKLALLEEEEKERKVGEIQVSQLNIVQVISSQSSRG